MNVCYAVTSAGWDQYAQMACVSALLVKRWHPAARITIFGDEITCSQLERQRNKLVESVDQVVRVQTGGLPTATQRSRFVKTTMRQNVSGDFIYLDADTIPLGRFDELLRQSEPLGAALEHNRGLDDQFFPSDMPSFYERLGWRHPAVPYFNAGVLVVRDCPDAHTLFRSWHKKWRQSLQTGSHQDQPALNSAIFDGGHKVRILDPSFNAMVSYFYSPWRFRGARIAHFFSANPIGGTLLSHLVDHLGKTNEIDWEAYEACRRQGHPWAHGGEPWQLWRSGNYTRALAKKIARRWKHSRQNRSALDLPHRS